LILARLQWSLTLVTVYVVETNSPCPSKRHVVGETVCPLSRQGRHRRGDRVPLAPLGRCGLGRRDPGGGGCRGLRRGRMREIGGKTAIPTASGSITRRIGYDRQDVRGTHADALTRDLGRRLHQHQSAPKCFVARRKCTVSWGQSAACSPPLSTAAVVGPRWNIADDAVAPIEYSLALERLSTQQIYSPTPVLGVNPAKRLGKSSDCACLSSSTYDLALQYPSKQYIHLYGKL
jgi:hypothetical protein